MSKGSGVISLMLVILLVSLTGCQQPEETSGVTLSPLQPTTTVAALSSPLPTLAGTSWPSGRVLYHADPTDVYQIYLVDNGEVSKLGIRGLPTTLLLDGRGKIVKSFSGFAGRSEMESIKREIEKLLAKMPTPAFSQALEARR